LQFAIDKRGGRLPPVEPEFTFVGDDMILCSTIWVNDDGTSSDLFQILTVRDGKIVDMQDCATRRRAERFARRRRT
jgi:hypothetical protein